MTFFPKWLRLMPDERRALSREEQDQLWREYAEFCLRTGPRGNTRPSTQGSNFNSNGWGR